MFIGIEYTTDQRYSNDYKIKKFRTESLALKWKNNFNNGKFSFEGSADENLPGVSQNWHRSFRKIYKIKEGCRLPTDSQVKKVLNKRPYRGSSMYHTSFDCERLSLLGWDNLIKIEEGD